MKLVANCYILYFTNRKEEETGGTNDKNRLDRYWDVSHAFIQGRRSLWDRGTCPPNIYEGGDVHGNMLEVMSYFSA